MTHFHTTLGTICLLPLLSSDTQASTAALGLSAELRVKHDRTFRYLIERLPSAKLSQAYATIQTTLNDLTTYVNEWLKYQYLWDIETSAVIARVGDNLETWQQLLIEIRVRLPSVEFKLYSHLHFFSRRLVPRLTLQRSAKRSVLWLWITQQLRQR